MSKKESVQKKLQRVRPPRVHLTYEVDIGGASEHKEIPFVVGVMGDFSGNSENPTPKLKDRKFVNIDVDNFDDVMKGMEPRAVFKVKNTLGEQEGQFGVELKFRSIEDFRPEAVVQQVEPLRKLLEARSKLSDLRNKLAGNDKLEDVLGEVLANTESLQRLGQETRNKDK